MGLSTLQALNTVVFAPCSTGQRCLQNKASADSKGSPIPLSSDIYPKSSYGSKIMLSFSLIKGYWALWAHDPIAPEYPQYSPNIPQYNPNISRYNPNVPVLTQYKAGILIVFLVAWQRFVLILIDEKHTVTLLMGYIGTTLGVIVEVY